MKTMKSTYRNSLLPFLILIIFLLSSISSAHDTGHETSPGPCDTSLETSPGPRASHPSTQTTNSHSSMSQTTYSQLHAFHSSTQMTSHETSSGQSASRSSTQTTSHETNSRPHASRSSTQTTSHETSPGPHASRSSTQTTSHETSPGPRASRSSTQSASRSSTQTTSHETSPGPRVSRSSTQTTSHETSPRPGASRSSTQSASRSSTQTTSHETSPGPRASRSSTQTTSHETSPGPRSSRSSTQTTSHETSPGHSASRSSTQTTSHETSPGPRASHSSTQSASRSSTKTTSHETSLGSRASRSSTQTTSHETSPGPRASRSSTQTTSHETSPGPRASRSSTQTTSDETSPGPRTSRSSTQTTSDEPSPGPRASRSSTQTTSHETSPGPRASLSSTQTTNSQLGASHSSTQSTKSQLDATHSSTQTANSQLHASFKGSFSKIFTFGGSEADTGNARLLGAISGESSSDRLSDGRLVVDFLCDALSLPTPPPYKGPSAADCKTGVNFAVAGATTLSGDFFKMHNVSSLLWKGVPIGFDAQIDWFDKYMINEGCKGGHGRSSCKVDMEKSLFWIGEIGVSDYITALRSPIPLPQVAEVSVRIVCNLLKAMLDNGAKYVVVQGLPPVGCFPAYMSSNPDGRTDEMGCVASANMGVMNHNQALESKLIKFRKVYPNSTIVYADYWNAYLTILTNAKKHHMQETSKPCCTSAQGKFTFKLPFFSASLSASTCKDPQNFMSWDGIHLTEAMNKNLADLFLNQGFCKPSFSELVMKKKTM